MPDYPRKTRGESRAVQRAQRQLCEHLGVWRRLRSLTSAQLSERSGVSPDTISRIENGNAASSTLNLLKIADALGILDQLVAAVDPYGSDIGRMRAGEHLPQRVRHRDLSGGSDV